MTANRNPELVHPDGCWMDPRPHRHVIHLLERPEANRVSIGLPRPLPVPAPTVRRIR